MKGLRAHARYALERVETGFDQVFTPTWNPLYQLGALGWFFYWIVVASGVYLYIFFDSGVTDAYASVEAITHAQWYAGGVMRSFHRYASDALVLVVVVHLSREFILDRMRGPRWFAWVTGVVTLWLILAAGITGYWIIWDQLAQYVAIASTEWLDTLPIFGEPISRNFLHSASLSGRFFTLMVFIHIAVPLVLLLVMWLHIHRHVGAKVNPAGGLAIGTAATMLGLALLQPAYSQGPADLDMAIGEIQLDWFYLGIMPLTEALPGFAMWLAVGALTLVLVALPWLPPARGKPVAIIDLANCNGCGRCYDDCPFGAIDMGPRTDGGPYQLQAIVNEAQCVSCGLCTGSCPTATPFRTRSELMAGIEQPALTTHTLREQCLHATESLTGPARVLIVGCQHGVEIHKLTSPAVGIIELPCVGMLPPSYMDFLLSRNHVDGLLLAGCRDGDCHYRHGIRWTTQRIAAERDPYLRKRVPRDHIETAFTGIDGNEDLVETLASFRERLDQDEVG